MILPDCGHVPQFEYRERTADLTRDFIAALPAGARPTRGSESVVDATSASAAV